MALNRNASGDLAGSYYTASGATPEEQYKSFKELKPPMPDWRYNVPLDVNHGPFPGDGLAGKFGPIATSRPWTPFACTNRTPGALPLPLTIDSMDQGFKVSSPPVFNMGGHQYIPMLPPKVGQLAAQYYGNAQNDFRVAPATKDTKENRYIPATFPVPSAQEPGKAFTKLEGFSDWAATASLTNTDGRSVSVTFATGSPLAFITFDKKSDYGCLTLSRLPTAPVRSWFPEGYRCERPAGITIEIGGAPVVTDDHHPDLKVEIRAGSSGPSTWATVAVRKGATKEDLAKALQRAVASGSGLFEVSEVKPTKNPPDNFEFLVSPRDASIVLQQKDATVSPTERQQIVLVARQESAHPVDPPADASVVGFTIGYIYTPGEKAPQSTYYASYAAIAPTGARWLFDEARQLVCDFTKATTETRTLIVCAMPTLGADAYRMYDDLGAGAAVQLRRWWRDMAPFAYGCPRHVVDGRDDGTMFGPNEGNRFTPRVKTEQGRTSVTTEFWVNLTYPAGRPAGAGGTLFCLFPHQYRGYANNTAKILGGAEPWQLTYRTSAGPLKLAGGGASAGQPAFTTTYVFPGILPHIPNDKLTGAESFNVYDYPNPQPYHTTTQKLNGQMVRDAATPVWGADLSQNGYPRAFIPVPPHRQQRYAFGSYDWGKLLGLLGDLIPCAKDLKNTEAVNAAVRQLNAQLGQWLSGGLVNATDKTAWPPGVERWQKQERGLPTFAGAQGLMSNQQFLYYDQQWSSLIPYPTGFDADTLLNDHHFHYGYWVRAAAQLALAQARGLDPDNPAGTFIKNYGATVNLIVKDIANPLRGDQQAIGTDAKAFPNGPKMPFLRYFDGYCGHSWASGLRINIIDQESVSEAMSAWTGVILWGEVTKDAKMRDLGIWMYTHEMMAFYEYWMDCAEGAQKGSLLFPPGSDRTIGDQAYDEAIKGGVPDVSAVPGFFCHVFNGYRQLSTFFGWEPIYMTGIQWMPFHGGSLYLNSSDEAVQWKLGWQWKWSAANSRYIIENKDKPLATITQGIDGFVNELNASVNDKDASKHVTEGLRGLFIGIGFNLATRDDEDKSPVKERVIVAKLSDNQWTVADFGGKKYTIDRKSGTLELHGSVDVFRFGDYAPTWEPIAWQALALIDPNGDQIFWDKPPVPVTAEACWGKLAEAVGSPGDKVYAGKGWSPLGGQAVSYSYYWIFNVRGLGVRDAGTSADSPYAVKFLGPKATLRAPRKPTYVAWNPSDARRTVTFSDGHQVRDVEPYSYKVDRL
jgi:hypothetical protein